MRQICSLALFIALTCAVPAPSAHAGRAQRIVQRLKEKGADQITGNRLKRSPGVTTLRLGLPDTRGAAMANGLIGEVWNEAAQRPALEAKELSAALSEMAHLMERAQWAKPAHARLQNEPDRRQLRAWHEGTGVEVSFDADASTIDRRGRGGGQLTRYAAISSFGLQAIADQLPLNRSIATGLATAHYLRFEAVKAPTSPDYAAGLIRLLNDRGQILGTVPGDSAEFDRIVQQAGINHAPDLRIHNLPAWLSGRQLTQWLQLIGQKGSPAAPKNK